MDAQPGPLFGCAGGVGGYDAPSVTELAGAVTGALIAGTSRVRKGSGGRHGTPTQGDPMSWLSIVNLLATIAIPVIGAWLVKKVKTPTDLDRAALLAHIAEAAAALVVSLNPKADWATLLAQVVQQIAKAAGLPTDNAGAIERAAANALMKLGKAPAV